MLSQTLRFYSFTLAGVAQWIEHEFVNQVSGSIPRAHAWIVGQVPSWGHARDSQQMFLSYITASVPLLLLPFPSNK